MANAKSDAFEGRVAIVCGGDSPVGRAVALAIAARGARVVVGGANERALGETVGEIAYGGGKARHVAGDPKHGAHHAAVVARAIDVFGPIDVVISVCDEDATKLAFEAARRVMGARGHLVALGEDADEDAAVAVLIERLIQADWD